MKLLTFFVTWFLTRYFKWLKNQKRVKIWSQEIYIFSETSTVYWLHYQIFESSKKSSLQIKLVPSSSFLWNTMLGSAVFLQYFIWRISSIDIKQLIYLIITKDQSAPPWSTCTFDRLINSFSVNFILTILFTTCKMGIRPWVIDFRFGRGISGR